MLAWRKGFYGYMIAAITFMTYLLAGGSYYSLSVLTPVMAKDFGWSATQFGAAFSILILLMGIASPFGGAFVARFGPRLAMLIGTTMVAISLGLLSVMTQLWQFYLIMVIVGLGFAIGIMLPIQQLIGNWFNLRRSLFLGVVMAGAGLGGLVMSTLASQLLGSLGTWRTTWQVLSGLVAIIVPLILLFLRDKPTDLGQQPDGVRQEASPHVDAPSPQPLSHVYRTADHWSVKPAVKTLSFWQIALGLGFMQILLQAVVAHQVAYLSSEVGLSLSVAASAVGLVTTCSIAGRLASGWLADRLEPRIIFSGLLLMQGLGLAILVAGQGLASLYPYVVLFGMGYGGVVVLTPTMLLNYFGNKHFAVLMGIATPIGSVLGTVSPMLVGHIKDSGGSYMPAFVGLSGLAIIGALTVFLALPPTARAMETRSQI